VTLDDTGAKVTITDKAGTSSNSTPTPVLSRFPPAATRTDTGGTLKLTVTGGVTISCPAGITLDSPSVKLGTGASLALANETLLTLFNTHFHVGNLGAPTSRRWCRRCPACRAPSLPRGPDHGGRIPRHGWKFPVRLTAAGEIALVREEEDIREAIRIILGTAPGSG